MLAATARRRLALCDSPWLAGGGRHRDTGSGGPAGIGDLDSAVTLSWRRKWHPTPVFLPGGSHGRRSLVGYSPRGRKESDTTGGALGGETSVSPFAKPVF